MSVLILVMLGLAVFHFVYEGIVLPSYRMKLRHDAFELRDELRTLVLDGRIDRNDLAFEVVETGLNNLARRVHMLSFNVHRQMRRMYTEDETFRRRVDARHEALKSSSNEDLRRIVIKADRIFERAFVANAGGWFVLAPVVFCLAGLFSVSWLVMRLLAAPSQALEKLMPFETHQQRQQAVYC
jgi:hypothetical protein